MLLLLLAQRSNSASSGVKKPEACSASWMLACVVVRAREAGASAAASYGRKDAEDYAGQDMSILMLMIVGVKSCGMKGSYSIPSSAAVLACNLLELTEVALVAAAGAGGVAWKQPNACSSAVCSCISGPVCRSWLLLGVPNARCTSVA
jgi:hypothetical protein